MFEDSDKEKKDEKHSHTCRMCGKKYECPTPASKCRFALGIHKEESDGCYCSNCFSSLSHLIESKLFELVAMLHALGAIDKKTANIIASRYGYGDLEVKVVKCEADESGNPILPDDYEQ